MSAWMDKNGDKSIMGSANPPTEVEPYVKITLSPNTPSPEPRDDDDEEDQESSEEFSVLEKQQEAFETCHSAAASEAYVDNISDPEQQWKIFRDIPVCVDFGIQDYLCRGHEGEFDLSSDTDTSYLGATPPHRFSDGEIDPIEALPVLLDTELNLRGTTSPERSVVPATRIPISCSLNETPKFFTEFHEQAIFRRVNHPPTKFRQVQLNERSLPRPFRRNVSLPAAIFKTFLVEQPPKNAITGESSQSKAGPIVCIGSVPSCPEPSTTTAIVRLGTIESISNSSQVNLLETEEESGIAACEDSFSMNGRSLESAWNSGDSLDSETNGVDNQPFTSELEKRSLIIRHMRRLIRQDTTGNFAPPDFHI